MTNNRELKQLRRRQLSFCFLILNKIPKNSTPEKVDIERVQIDAIKFERTQIHFLMTFSLPSSSSLLKAPNNDQFGMNTHVLWCYLITHNRNKQKNSRQPQIDANNERRIINNCQKAQRIVFAKAAALSLSTI